MARGSLQFGFGHRLPVVLMLLVQLAPAVARTGAIMLAGSTLNYQWSGGLFDHLTRLPLDWYEKRHVGDVISRFGSRRSSAA